MRFNKEGSRGVCKCVRHSTTMDGPGRSGQTLNVALETIVKSAIVPFHLFTPLLQSASLFINPSPCCTPHIKFDGTFLSIHHLAAHPTSGERH
ncbi:hypothetical protein TNCV_129181 [Trichonephila clavipes]|nr:hypothetical protein TNCV_129181 [Trichonephila clavipes]